MGDDIPLSVWPVAQRTSRGQRSGRYLPESRAHPAKMLPALARHVIESYTLPGDLVLDPMCGIGATLVEAVHLGRDALGVEYEPRWAALAEANLAHAAEAGATGSARVMCGDARDLAELVDSPLRDRVALVLTSPPYGPSVHGDARAVPGRGVTKRNDRYSRDPDNLAHVATGSLLDAFSAILAACVPFLRPDGTVAVTARPWRERGHLVDLPSGIHDAAQRAGLIPFERNVALLAALRGDRLVPRASFFQLTQVERRANGAGRCSSSPTRTCSCSASRPRERHRRMRARVSRPA